MSKRFFRPMKKTIRYCAVFVLCGFCLNLLTQDLSPQATSILLGHVKVLLKKNRPVT